MSQVQPPLRAPLHGGPREAPAGLDNRAGLGVLLCTVWKVFENE
jgi:hypothetical protein